ncbi:S41 family peptidase [Vallitalea okinawensis]|uniref:S41 family peptidase n=1 Tax=Vallitalea okinawensis TaxID=2078660 RepID=UPI000CFB1246|nr:S41 family peptidase [Vallitalea okinawensis]
MKIKKIVASIICFSSILFLSACTDKINDTFKRLNSEVESAFNDFQDEMDALMGDLDGYADNDRGLELLDEGKAEEALVYFNKNLEKFDDQISEPYNNVDNELLDITLSNISSAYVDLGELDLALEYIDKALNVQPNTAEEYVIKGAIYFNLSQYDKALKYYDQAFEAQGDFNLAYYGKGEINFTLQQYDEALENFNHYLKGDPGDPDAEMYKAYCLLYTSGREEAINQIDETIRDNKDYYDAYYMKAVILEESGTFEEVEACYENTAKIFSDDLVAQIDLGAFYYYYGKYNKSLDIFQKLLEANPDNLLIYTWLIYNNTALEEYNQALELANTAIQKDNQYDELYNAIGNIYLEQTLYMESLEYFDKAIELNPDYEDAYINKLYGLYTGKRYARAVEFGLEAEESFPYSFDVLWYIADSYFELDELDEVISYYDKMLKILPDNDEIISYQSYTYFLLQDYDKAEEYSDEALALNSENYTALLVRNELVNKEVPLEEQVVNFFDDYYFYDNKDMTGTERDKINNGRITSDTLDQLVDTMRKSDDLFTLAVYGDEYDYFMDMEQQDMTYDYLSDNTIYTKINTFAMYTDNKFTVLLDSIQEPENKTLIIDVRNNFGGDTDSANNMLDILLPECVTSTLIDKDGYTTNYYSDASMIPFKEIYIFVDENSASASELLTLGLKTYLNNVNVVGRNTFGKGVGQYVYEDQQNKLLLLVVNHYWNVRQTNIMDVGIAPDIYVSGNELDDFLKAIK